MKNKNTSKIELKRIRKMIEGTHCLRDLKNTFFQVKNEVFEINEAKQMVYARMEAHVFANINEQKYTVVEKSAPKNFWNCIKQIMPSRIANWFAPVEYKVIEKQTLTFRHEEIFPIADREHNMDTIMMTTLISGDAKEIK